MREAFSRLTIVYIPGLGDDIVGRRQEKYLRWWGMLHHAQIHFFDPEWHKPEPYVEKWQRLQEMFAPLNPENTIVIGVSAGGSLAVRLLNQAPTLRRVVTVCGKLKGFQTIGKSYLERTPALYESVKASEEVGKLPDFASSKLQCYRSLMDPIVPLKDSIIDGCHKKRIPIIGHTPAIVFYLAFMLPKR